MFQNNEQDNTIRNAIWFYFIKIVFHFNQIKP